MNSDDLFLQTAEKTKKFKFEVVQAKLHATYVRVASSVKLEIEKALSTREAKYHFRAPLVRIWSIPRHSLDFEATEVFSNSKIPSILIVGLALTSNIHG